jgi:hypothetical protein
MRLVDRLAAVALAALSGLATAQTDRTPQSDWSYLQSRPAAVGRKVFGLPAPGGDVSRVVDIGAGTRALHVTRDERIEVRSGNRSFNWQFSTWTTESFDLALIAPPGFPAADVRVYVSENPLYKGL